jgi:hypothetical protein
MAATGTMTAAGTATAEPHGGRPGFQRVEARLRVVHLRVELGLVQVKAGRSAAPVEVVEVGRRLVGCLVEVRLVQVKARAGRLPVKVIEVCPGLVDLGGQVPVVRGESDPPLGAVELVELRLRVVEGGVEFLVVGADPDLALDPGSRLFNAGLEFLGETVEIRRDANERARDFIPVGDG